MRRNSIFSNIEDWKSATLLEMNSVIWDLPMILIRLSVFFNNFLRMWNIIHSCLGNWNNNPRQVLIKSKYQI